MFPNQPVDPLGSRTQRMTRTEVYHAIAFAARHPEARVVALQQLTPDLFTQYEVDFILFWRGFCRAAKISQIPVDPIAARDMVWTACVAEAATDLSRLEYTDQVQATVLGAGGIVQEVFERFIVSEETKTFGYNLLSRFLRERALSDPLRVAIAGLGQGETLADPDAVVRLIERGRSVANAVSSDPGSLGVSVNPLYRPPLPELYTTSFDWLDVLMNGGQAAGEAYCLLGGTGSGKTSLAMQIAVEAAKLQVLAATGGREAGYWYYISWEADRYELEQRLYCYGAKIHADTYRKREPFSTMQYLKPYEQAPEINPPGQQVQSETDRLQDFADAFGGDKGRLVLVDYSGRTDDHGTSFGRGGLDEVIGYLRGQVARGRKIAGVTLDYAGICVARMISENTKYKPADEYVLLPGFIDKVRSQIAKPFHCSAWVLHQLHGEEATRASGVAIHHSKARGSRNIADNADFAFTIGNRDLQTGALVFNMSKFRRAPGREEPEILRFDGRFNRFSTTGGAYIIDRFTKRIVAAADAAGFSGPVRPDDLVDPRSGV